MAPASAALYIPTIVLIAFLSGFFSFPFSIFFLFSFLLLFLSFSDVCPLLTILFIFSFVFDCNELVSMFWHL